MNAANRYGPMHRTTRQRVSSWWLVSSLVLVVALLAGCVPSQPTASNAAITLRFAIADAEERPSEPYVREFVAQAKTLSKGNLIIEPVWDAGSSTFAGFER